MKRKTTIIIINKEPQNVETVWEDIKTIKINNNKTKEEYFEQTNAARNALAKKRNKKMLYYLIINLKHLI